jgi:MOSC domain-containing protein YiiM
MDSVARVDLDGLGLVGNANRGGRRAVTLIERETFERVRATLGPAVEPVMRRANFMVSGVRLAGSRGRVLTIGRARIRIGGETRPCERMDEALPGLRAALEPDWGGGAYGTVLEGGEVAVGDPVDWEQLSLLPGASRDG